MTARLYPADHPHACDNAFRRCGMLREGGFKRLDRPVRIERRRTLTLLRFILNGCTYDRIIVRAERNAYRSQRKEKTPWTTD